MFIVTATYHPTARFDRQSVELTLEILANGANGTRIQEPVRHSDRKGTRSPRYIFDSREGAEEFQGDLGTPDRPFKPEFTTALVEEKE